MWKGLVGMTITNNIYNCKLVAVAGVSSLAGQSLTHLDFSGHLVPTHPSSP